jgi:hypothetical protein
MARPWVVGIAILCAAAPRLRAQPAEPAPAPPAPAPPADAAPPEPEIALPEAEPPEPAPPAVVPAGETITVQGELPPAAPGAMRASRDELHAMPGTGGDLMQTVAAMPGVAATALPLGATGVVIRGSSPQDSKILVDGFEVPVLYHALGLRSVVREEAIDALDYLPGGFDVSLGRATSGIVSVTTRAGGDGPRVEVEPSTESIGALAQGRAGDLRYMIAVRRSVIDLLLPLVLPEDLDLSLVTVPRYYDEQLRLDYRLSPRWELQVSSLGSDDALDLYTDRGQSPEHHFADRSRFLRAIAAARFRDGAWSGRVELSGIVEQHDTQLGAVQHLRVTTPAVTARGELERAAGDLLGLTGVTWRLGGEAVHTRNTIDVALPREVREGETMPTYDLRDTALRVRDRVITDDLAAWAAASAGAGPVRATLGARLDAFRNSRDAIIEPRADVAIRLTPRLVARLSAGSYARPPEYQSELLTRGLHAERAIQLIAGLTYDPADGVRVQASIYDTERRELITRGPDGELTNAGRGATIGAELTATLRRGPWFAWLTYSFSRSTRVDAPGAASRLFDFDQPHHLEALASYRRGNWTFGARFRLLSGLPYTPVMSSVFDSDRNLYRPIYGAVNSERAEAHHEIDLRIERRYKWGPLRATQFLDVQNVYLNQSAVTYLYSYDYSQRVALTWLPIFPTLGIRVEW